MSGAGQDSASPGSNSPEYRQATWQQLQSEVFDLLIIGGGINGAAVARDAVLRGMSVALVERSDFASGTSSRSSKLIHGGVRYLEQGDIGLVLESCRERDLLRTRIAPHLVRAQRFLFPIYADDSLPLWKMRAGLLAYDMLAAFRNVETHRGLGAAEVMAEEPGLLSEGLEGGAVYWDCWTDDARLTVETVLAARSGGAAVLNYAEVVALDKDSTGRLASAVVRDLELGREARVRARCFVNTSGPWLDALRKLDDGGTPPRLRATKGAHVIFDRARLPVNNAVVIRGAGDNRVMFAIPWQTRVLVGTTDTWYEGDPAEVSVEKEDVDYILASANRAFPMADLLASDVVSSYAGLRPLVQPEDELDESDVSRDDQVFESPSGLVSLGGGKLTTHRHVAERIVNRVARWVGRPVGRCRTAQVPLPGAAGVEPGAAMHRAPGSGEEHVRWRYGARAAEVSALVRGDEELATGLVDDTPDLKAELVHAVDQEMAMSLEDALTRRTHVTLESAQVSEQLARSAAALLAEHLGWDDERVELEVKKYLASVQFCGATTP
ncbi:MAG TPA: glycerol-3-phosphate dehydrogenase/oxidase [Deltaproteobacteria bacterium]|nr:glycerol-3-phosphate dehydrogenase/oxidase [Candidatus Binatota bacterium]HIL12498.1 glycerol-3-phosphate dehydrogenase/oxidase [Deltaproteobacteria bacterium]